MKTILLTGGSKGIGRAVVEHAVKKNYFVIFTYNKNKKISLNLHKKYPNKTLPIKVNLSLAKDRKKLFTILKKKKIKIDCLINNAAFDVKRKKIENISISELKSIYEVNVFAVYDLIKNSIKLMKKKNWKSIINISSTAAKYGGKFYTHYAPTKSAIENLTIGLSRELSERKIRVVCVAPGVIDSKLENRKNIKIINSIPNARLGKSEEVAKLIIWLSSDDAEYINGTTITIAGGR